VSMFGPPENVHLPDGPVCGWTVWPLCHAAGSGQGTFRARIQRLVEKRLQGFRDQDRDGRYAL
jgi:hypothetical protein